MTTSLVFRVHDERLAIVRWAPDVSMPAWARGRFLSITRTPSELSLVCAQAYVPGTLECERERIAFGIEGVVPMTTVGLLAALCGALAAANVPVFAISTYDTDYLLVPLVHFEAASAALRSLGHRVDGLSPGR